MRYLILALALTLCLLQAQGQATPIEVVFRVDMSNTDDVSEVSLVGGSISGWCTDCHIMTDENGDGIYQITIELLPGGHEYRFANGGTLEVFEPFIGECTTTTADGEYTNRYLFIDSEETNLILPAYCFEQCDLCFSPGCTDPIACNFNWNAFGDDGSCDYSTCAGCMNDVACNYDAAATLDNGSCDYCFCGEGTQWIDSLQACMVTEAALMQACGEGTYWDDLAQACLTIETCQEDLDGDGIVGINDLLELLSSFGSECVIEPETAEWTCGEPVNYHGYDYATVQIGDQCWFAENLRTEHYINGDAIPANLSLGEWWSTASGAVAVNGETDDCYNYSPDGNSCDPDWSLNEYGRLYNWYAVDDSRELCPTGWHVPTDDEWTVLTDLLGGISVAGDQMKTTYGWYGNGNGFNWSGFAGLPGGMRSSDGFWVAGSGGAWWSATPTEDPIANDVWIRELSYQYPSIGRWNSDKRNGFSVRCLKDN